MVHCRSIQVFPTHRYHSLWSIASTLSTSQKQVGQTNSAPLVRILSFFKLPHQLHYHLCFGTVLFIIHILLSLFNALVLYTHPDVTLCLVIFQTFPYIRKFSHFSKIKGAATEIKGAVTGECEMGKNLKKWKMMKIDILQ